MGLALGRCDTLQRTIKQKNKYHKWSKVRKPDGQAWCIEAEVFAPLQSAAAGPFLSAGLRFEDMAGRTGSRAADWLGGVDLGR